MGGEGCRVGGEGGRVRGEGRRVGGEGRRVGDAGGTGFSTIDFLQTIKIIEISHL